MATSSVGSATGSLSSIGLGSGLDVNSIVTQLRTIEERPLTLLQNQATAIDAKVSAFGQIQSLFSTLSDAANKLAQSSTWSARTVASSDASTVSATADSTAAVTTLSVEVQQLAKPQIGTTAALPAGQSLGAGTITLQLGTWADDGSGGKVFTAGSSAPVSINVAAGSSLASVATQINKANAGVTATVVSGTSGAQLLLRSKDTGAAQGFQLTSDVTLGTSGNTLALDTAAPGTQWSQDAVAAINGIAVQSASNTLTGAVPGLSITLNKTTTAGNPVQLDVSADTGAMKTAIQDFVSAYNAVNTMIGNLTAYNANAPAGQQASLLQGDSTATLLQNQLRNLLSSTVKTSFGNMSLSDIGITLPPSVGGVVTSTNLQIDDAKLSAALTDVNKVQEFFTADTGSMATEGMARKFKDFTFGVLSVQGTLSVATKSLQNQKKNLTDQQDRITARIDQWETNLRKQYTALDATMAKMTALNNYVAQQIAQWNKSLNNG